MQPDTLQWFRGHVFNHRPVELSRGSGRAGREGALRAVTLEAAYSIGLEKEVGSIVPGKLANFTLLAENTLTSSAASVKDLAVLGTVHERRKLPVHRDETSRALLGPAQDAAAGMLLLAEHCRGDHDGDGGDVCTRNRLFAAARGTAWNQEASK